MNVPHQDRTIKQGVMKMLSDKPFWWVVPSIMVGVIAFAAAVAISVSTGMRLLGYLAILIIGLPAEFMFIFARTGKRCEYEADDEKLTIRRPNKPFDGPNDRTLPQDTPFAILGERIPQRVTDNEIISGNEYYNN